MFRARRVDPDRRQIVRRQKEVEHLHGRTLGDAQGVRLWQSPVGQDLQARSIVEQAAPDELTVKEIERDRAAVAPASADAVDGAQISDVCDEEQVVLEDERGFSRERPVLVVIESAAQYLRGEPLDAMATT